MEFLDNINIVFDFDKYVDYICYLVNKEFNKDTNINAEAKIINCGKYKEFRVDICFTCPACHNWHASIDIGTFREWFEDNVKIEDVVKYTKEIISTTLKTDLIEQVNIKVHKLWKDNNNG